MLSLSPIGAFLLCSALRLQVNAITSQQGPHEETNQPATNCSTQSLEGENETQTTHSIGENHSVHNVLTILSRAAILKWMLHENNVHGDKHIASNAVKKFQQFFRAKPNANNSRPSCL